MYSIMVECRCFTGLYSIMVECCFTGMYRIMVECCFTGMYRIVVECRGFNGM